MLCSLLHPRHAARTAHSRTHGLRQASSQDRHRPGLPPQDRHRHRSCCPACHVPRLQVGHAPRSAVSGPPSRPRHQDTTPTCTPRRTRCYRQALAGSPQLGAGGSPSSSRTRFSQVCQQAPSRACHLPVRALGPAIGASLTVSSAGGIGRLGRGSPVCQNNPARRDPSRAAQPPMPLRRPFGSSVLRCRAPSGWQGPRGARDGVLAVARAPLWGGGPRMAARFLGLQVRAPSGTIAEGQPRQKSSAGAGSERVSDGRFGPADAWP